jgi:hypothetical protein
MERADFVTVWGVWQDCLLLPFGAPATGGDHRPAARDELCKYAEPFDDFITTEIRG